MFQHRDGAAIILPVFIPRTWRIASGKKGCLISPPRIGLPAFLAAFIMAFPCQAVAQDQGPVALWSFDSANGAVVRDAVNGTEDKVGGFCKYVPGVSGNGLRFDGYTTSVVRKAQSAPKLWSSFSVDAWIALDTYPWNWIPVVDQEQDRQSGYFFGLDAFGHVSLQVAIHGVWQSVTSTVQIPLKKWANLTGTFDENSGLAIYLDGKPVGSLAVNGPMLPAPNQDLLIGRVREPALPFPSFSINPHHAVWYSLDGILDEVAIYDRALSADEIQQTYASAHAPAGDVVPWPVLPPGPPAAGPFGAFYATLKLEDTWDRLRRIGPDSDVVVRFDDSPARLVFWQGAGYVPYWLTENGTGYTDEFLEGYASECPDTGDCEPMSDKQDRYSRVNIVESTDARVVVHWRYALAEVVHYLGAEPDPLTGWFDWADEYWTVYPDGVAIRRQVLHPTDQTKGFEWQETIIINPPGRSPDDDINWDALTVGNMKGETATYTWQPKPPGEYGWIHQPDKIDKPDNPNIQVVNLKSTWKPFQIVPPIHAWIKIFTRAQSIFSFGCWNHWPITQIASSGRYCVAADRASHGSLSHIYWDDYDRNDGSITKILMAGLTTKSAAELLPLAKSWVSAPPVDVKGDAFQSKGYDQAQRAFIVVREEASKPAALELTLRSSDSSPVVNPAIVLRNWGDAAAQLKIDGKPANWGKDFRRGFVKHLDGTDMIVWIRQTSIVPVHIVLTPEQ